MAKSVTAKGGASEAEVLGGTRKAAILMMALSADVSAKVLRLLDQEVVEEITREIASLDLVRPAQRGEVIEEFYNLALARQYVEQGGLLFAKSLLDKALTPEQATRLMRQIEQHGLKKPFACLANPDAE